MIYIFLELPYEKQLKRIDFLCVENFKQEIIEEVNANGGDFSICNSYFVCSIKNETIAYYYSASRLLFNIKNIIEKYHQKIHEVRCIVKFFDEDIIINSYSDLFFEFKKMLIPTNDIFFIGDNVLNLEKYISFEKTENNFLKAKEFKFFTEKNKIENKYPPHSIILHKNENYFWSLYNFILLNPLDENEIDNLQDKEIFDSTKTVFKYLKRHRFSKEMPQYFIDAFITHTGIYLKYFLPKNKNNPVSILIDSKKDKRNLNEAKKIFAVNTSIEIKEFDSELPSIYSIPEDLLELIYVILLAGRYLFYDEFNEFLLFLNKSSEFFSDLYDWMFSNGIILIPNNINAICYGLIEIIERRIRKNKEIINLYIANFLWTKYMSGDLFPDLESEQIFKSLNFKIEDDFFVSYIFNKSSDSVVEGIDLLKYKNYKFYDPLKYYQQALIARRNGSIANAFPLAKTALTMFQENKFSAGEYRTLSLLAFFNLQENKKQDALTYFLYSLDSAEQTCNPDFICEALFNISLTYFLNNNLKQCLTFLNKLSNSVLKYFKQDWKIPGLFIKGRVYLQTGNFEKALECFELTNDFAETYFENLAPLCKVWGARALMYSGEIKQAKEIFYKNLEKTDDAALFLMESFLLAGNLKKEFAALDINRDNIYIDYYDKKFYENENLKSGFSFVEDLLLSKTYNCSVGKKMFLAFYNYYNYKINYPENNENDFCSQYLSELETLAIEALYQKDSFASLYLFLCYELYSISQGETASSTTAYLSKAFKALQKTVVNIGENDIRDKYMSSNLWNKKLFAAAKQHKLI